jgi:hypothetical protein
MIQRGIQCRRVRWQTLEADSLRSPVDDEFLEHVSAPVTRRLHIMAVAMKELETAKTSALFRLEAVRSDLKQCNNVMPLLYGPLPCISSTFCGWYTTCSQMLYAGLIGRARAEGEPRPVSPRLGVSESSLWLSA